MPHQISEERMRGEHAHKEMIDPQLEQAGWYLRDHSKVKIVHAEDLAGDIATAKSGRYYIGCYLQKALEAESMWGRFVAFKEGS